MWGGELSGGFDTGSTKVTQDKKLTIHKEGQGTKHSQSGRAVSLPNFCFVLEVVGGSIDSVHRSTGNCISCAKNTGSPPFF